MRLTNKINSHVLYCKYVTWNNLFSNGFIQLFARYCIGYLYVKMQTYSFVSLTDDPGVSGTQRFRSLPDFLVGMFIEKCFIWVMHSTKYIMLTCMQLFEDNYAAMTIFILTIPGLLTCCLMHYTINLFVSKNEHIWTL